ncbi:MAG TPA: WhiB family transcriptional regulator [Acidimicrobiales bacterium]|nr:WhiB family transcriptional regulator [Acidimicrobiales bacterium]
MLAQQEKSTYEEDSEAIDWSAVAWDRAACRSEEGTLVDLFFSEQLDDIARAKAICQTCPVMEPCLQGARERREPWGVWGGQLFMNGVILPYKRKRGRPPKHLSVAALGA